MKSSPDWLQTGRNYFSSSIRNKIIIPYALLTLVGYHLPLWMRTGAVGLAKSFLYALLIVWITGWLERKKLRLKI